MNVLKEGDIIAFKAKFDGDSSIVILKVLEVIPNLEYVFGTLTKNKPRDTNESSFFNSRGEFEEEYGCKSLTVGQTTKDGWLVTKFEDGIYKDSFKAVTLESFSDTVPGYQQMESRLVEAKAQSYQQTESYQNLQAVGYNSHYASHNIEGVKDGTISFIPIDLSCVLDYFREIGFESLKLYKRVEDGTFVFMSGEDVSGASETLDVERERSDAEDKKKSVVTC